MTIKTGNSSIKRIQLGSSIVKSAYLGSKLVYGSAITNVPSEFVPELGPDDEYNIFVFNTSIKELDGTSYDTITLHNSTKGDTTTWNGLTDWGDGTVNSELSHTYNVKGTYLVKTKWVVSDDYGGLESNTRAARVALIKCLNVNKNITEFSHLFYKCENLKSVSFDKNTTYNINTMDFMFSGCYNLKSIDLSNINTSKVTNMLCTFEGCKSLTSLDISKLNTSNVTIMQAMFSYCSSLTYINLSSLSTSFITSKVTDMSFMFNMCTNLTTINLSGLRTSNVTNMQGMFQSCQKLENIYGIGNFNTYNVKNTKVMFGHCYALASLDLSHWDLTNANEMTSMFGGCSNLTLSSISMDYCNQTTINKITKAFNSTQ